MENILLKIRPSIDNFLKCPDRENLKILQNQLKSTDSDKLDSYQSYILIPLVVKIEELTKNKNTELKVELIETVQYIVNKIYIKDLNALKTITIIILQQVHNFQTGKIKDTDISEELKLAVIECISKIFERCILDVLEKFYKRENCNLIGKLLVTCIDIIQKEKYRKLKIASIKCLQVIFYVHKLADPDDIILRNQVGDTVFLFLPKIVNVLVDIAIGDEKNGTTLILLSIKTLGKILNIIFEDDIETEQTIYYEKNDFLNLLKQQKSKVQKTKDEEILGINIKSPNVEENFKKLQDNGRNSEWLDASSRKLKQIFKKISILQGNASSIIRFEFAKFSCLLATKCTTNLKENFIIFIETIIALSEDEENLDIQNICKTSIETLKNCKFQNDFNTILEQLFDLHITKLPRIIHRCEESQQYSEFLFLKGFFHILPDENLRLLLSVRDNLEKFLRCLIVAFDLKLTKDLLQEEYALRVFDEDDIDFNIFPWRKFKNLSSKKVELILSATCNMLGRTVVVHIIFDQLMEMLSKNLQIYNECILVLMLLLTVENDVMEIKNCKLLQNYMEEILDENHWHLELRPDISEPLQINKHSDWYIDRTPGLYESAIEIRTSDVNLHDNDDVIDNFVKVTDAQYNVLHTCLLLDAIGHTALTMREHFKPFVFKSLHKVLLKTGSSNYLVHKSGMYALHCIKKALNFTEISDLIENYSDYIAYHINFSLKKNYYYESNSGIDILTVVLRYSSINSISHLENIIETILYEITRSSHSSNTLTSYLKVFEVFLLNASKWTKEKLIEIHNHYSDKDEHNICDIFNKCMEVYNGSSNEFNAIDPIVTETHENNNSINEELFDNFEKPNLPKHIEIIIKILKNILKFIASKDQIQKIISLECFIHGLSILIDYENELLPLVHLVWYPYIERFNDNDPIVLHRCFTLLEILAKCAKDFILQKTLTDIIPSLNKFLQKSSTNSLGHTQLILTQEYKLQLKLLQEYGELIINIDIKNKPLDEITDVIILYIHKKQPRSLQDAAIKYFEIIGNYNRPLVYIKLLYYLNNFEFEENVKKIFECIGIKI